MKLQDVKFPSFGATTNYVMCKKKKENGVCSYKRVACACREVIPGYTLWLARGLTKRFQNIFNNYYILLVEFADSSVNENLFSKRETTSGPHSFNRRLYFSYSKALRESVIV